MSASSLIIANSKTFTVNNTLTLSGLDNTTLDLAAWQSYSPMASASSGTFTTITVTASYKTIGKTVLFQMIIDMTNIGSASGTLIVALPSTTATGTAFVVPGRENANTGKMCQGYVGGNETNLWINYYDNSSVIAAGNKIYISGAYESA